MHLHHIALLRLRLQISVNVSRGSVVYRTEYRQSTDRVHPGVPLRRVLRRPPYLGTNATSHLRRKSAHVVVLDAGRFGPCPQPSAHRLPLLWDGSSGTAWSSSPKTELDTQPQACRHRRLRQVSSSPEQNTHHTEYRVVRLRISSCRRRLR